LYGDDIYIGFDPEDITALELLRKEQWARIKGADDMTLNEKRRARGLDDLPGKIGDSILISGRGVLLGLDGEIISFEGGAPTAGIPAEPGKPGTLGAPPTIQDTAKDAGFRKLLIDSGYSEERADRIIKATRN
ncbi:MAG TPA: hypothetical protein VHQ92_10305, partial [Pseudolabrys sp.]|nr:hypothetical protein [Pseudolabrys sp.]